MDLRAVLKPVLACALGMLLSGCGTVNWLFATWADTGVDIYQVTPRSIWVTGQNQVVIEALTTSREPVYRIPGQRLTRRILIASPAGVASSCSAKPIGNVDGTPVYGFGGQSGRGVWCGAVQRNRGWTVLPASPAAPDAGDELLPVDAGGPVAQGRSRFPYTLEGVPVLLEYRGHSIWRTHWYAYVVRAALVPPLVVTFPFWFGRGFMAGGE